jgi:hypothetical protein
MKLTFRPVLPLLMLMSGCSVDHSAALQRLQDAGRILGEAETLELIGTFAAREKGRSEQLPLRIVFGPDGEYKLQSGDMIVVHDTWRVACVRPREPYSMCLPIRADHGRAGPYHRWSGDLIMAPMGLDGRADLIITYMRLLGPQWLQEWMPDAVVTGIAREQVGARQCTRYTVDDGPHGRCDFWLDDDNIMRKHARTRKGRLVIEYQQVILNSQLKPDEFAMPDGLDCEPEQ